MDNVGKVGGGTIVFGGDIFAPNSVENAVINVGGGFLPYAGGTIAGLIKGFSQQSSGDTYNTNPLSFAGSQIIGPSFGERLAGWLSGAGQTISEWFGGPVGQTGGGPTGATASNPSGTTQYGSTTPNLPDIAAQNKAAGWNGTPQIADASPAGVASNFAGLSIGNASGAGINTSSGNFSTVGGFTGLDLTGDFGAQQLGKGGM